MLPAFLAEPSRLPENAFAVLGDLGALVVNPFPS
jgi:hypothetical protein